MDDKDTYYAIRRSKHFPVCDQTPSSYRENNVLLEIPREVPPDTSHAGWPSNTSVPVNEVETIEVFVSSPQEDRIISKTFTNLNLIDDAKKTGWQEIVKQRFSKLIEIGEKTMQNQ